MYIYVKDKNVISVCKYTLTFNKNKYASIWFMQVNCIHMYIKVYKHRLMEDKQFQSVSKTKQSALPI